MISYSGRRAPPILRRRPHDTSRIAPHSCPTLCAEPQWGTTDTLEDAMAALKACWDSADVPIKWPPPMRPR